MTIQEFTVGPRFIFGKGATSALSNLAIQRAYLMCDPFIAQSHMIDWVLDPLRKVGAEVKTFSKIVPDPTITVISESLEQLKTFRPDTVIALGGGSAIDSTKAVIKVYTESEKIDKPTLIAIPTTSGTGSENTSFAVISDPSRNEKYALVDETMVPELAILDTDYVLSVPKAITADTGMDVLTHCLEAYVSNKASDFSDACAEKGMALTWQFLLEAYHSGDKDLAREKMHNASSLAGLAFNNAGLGICHSLSHAIGAFFHVPHGRINSLLLPYVIAFNASLDEKKESEVTKRYAQMANLLHLYGATSKQCVLALNYAIKNLSQKMGMPNQLEDLGIDRQAFEAKIPEMAQRALADACTPTNPRPVSLEELEAIYRQL